MRYICAIARNRIFCRDLYLNFQILNLCRIRRVGRAIRGLIDSECGGLAELFYRLDRGISSPCSRRGIIFAQGLVAPFEQTVCPLNLRRSISQIINGLWAR